MVQAIAVMVNIGDEEEEQSAPFVNAFSLVVESVSILLGVFSGIRGNRSTIFFRS